MKVVVAGAGNLGRFLAEDLSERGHDVVGVEQDLDTLNKARTHGTTAWIHGDACEPWVLEKAEITGADVLVAATGDDEDNLVISLLGKQEFAVPRVMARVNHPKNAWMFNDMWGVDVSVSPPHILASLVEEEVSVGDLVPLFRMERGQVSLVELKLPSDSPMVGKHIYDLRLPHDTAIVAIVREGHVIIAEPETPLLAGDEIMALASQGTQESLRNAILGR
ncbi:MAG: TrkA family potassium uptake protein [Actinomycetota bacterium]